MKRLAFALLAALAIGGATFVANTIVERQQEREATAGAERQWYTATRFHSAFSAYMGDLLADLKASSNDIDWWVIVNGVWADQKSTLRFIEEASGKDEKSAKYTIFPRGSAGDVNQQGKVEGYRIRAKRAAQIAVEQWPGEDTFYYEIEDGQIKFSASYGDDILKVILPVPSRQSLLTQDFMVFTGLVFLAGFFLSMCFRPGRSKQRRSLARELLGSEPDAAIYEEFFKNCPIGAVMIEDDGSIRDVNTQLADMLGYTRKELISTPIDDLVPSKYREGHMPLVSSFLRKNKAGGLTVAREVEALHSDGHAIPISLRVGVLDGYDFKGDRTVVGTALTAEIGA